MLVSGKTLNLLSMLNHEGSFSPPPSTNCKVWVTQNAYKFIHLLFCGIVLIVFWGILCFQSFFSLSLSLAPFILSFYLCISPPVTNSLLLYFSKSSCSLFNTFYSLCLCFSVSVVICFVFSLSLFHLLICKGRTRQKPIQQEAPT